MTVAKAMYQQIYCRYLCPGEAIVHDRGPEFCNRVVQDLQEHFGVKVRIISAGKPRANGLIETGVNFFKSRGRALMAELGNILVLKQYFWDGNLPENWDGTFFHKILSIMRSDPNSARGFAPGALLLGRELVYPIELTSEVDYSGSEFKADNLRALNNIHNEMFGKAGEKIEEYNNAYSKRVERAKNPTGLTLKVGDKVQLLKKKKSKMALQWTPYNSFYLVQAVNENTMKATLYCPKQKRQFKKTQPIIKLRKFRG